MGPRFALLWAFVAMASVVRAFTMYVGEVEIINVIPSHLAYHSNFTSYLGLAILVPLLFGLYEKAKNRMILEIEQAKQVSEQLKSEAQEAHAGARLVLDNVSQGLLLVDLNGEIQSEYSGALVKWFGLPEAGIPLWEYVGKHSKTLGNWLEIAWMQMNDGILSPEICLDQIPREIMMNNGCYLGVQLQYLHSDQVLSDQNKVLIVISDITDRINAEKAEDSRRELLLILEQLSYNRDYTRESLLEIGELIDVLSKSDLDSSEERRALHTLKGNSDILGLVSISRFCHSLEDKIVESRGRIASTDLEILVHRWDSVINKLNPFMTIDQSDIHVSPKDLDVLKSMAVKTKSQELASYVEDLSKESLERRFKLIGEQINRLSSHLGKGEIDIEIEDNGIRLPHEEWASFWGNFSHAIRNTIDHGIEFPEERKASSKNLKGTVRLLAKASKETLEISIEDDGRGVDWDRIKERLSKQISLMKTQIN